MQIMLQTFNKKNVSILVLILKCTILISDGDGEEHIDENEMEICDPCHCYGKCCLDVVASIFCVSLLWLSTKEEALFEITIIMCNFVIILCLWILIFVVNLKQTVIYIVYNKEIGSVKLNGILPPVSCNVLM